MQIEDDQQQREIDHLALTTRTGGAYIPPARLRQLNAHLTDKNTDAYQRMCWDALKKSINGLINKVSVSNMQMIVMELFAENLVRGRGLFARSLLRAQAASPIFTPIYAALLAVINTKLPAIGALVVSRLVVAFQRAYRRNDKSQCLASTKFLAHLVNHQVSHEIVALQVLALLLERPTDDSVEVAVGFIREVGAFLTDASPKATHATFERFRKILQESNIDIRVQYMIEVLFQVRKDKFKDNPTKPDELDLVEEEDQITHYIALDDELQVEELLDVFKFDPEYEVNEAKYGDIKTEILGESEDEAENDDAAADADVESEDEDAARARDVQELHKTMDIYDNTDTNIVNLRRTIYLTLKSSVDFEEACHKLLKMKLQPGQETQMCNMIIECCSQERSYEKFFGLIGERFCKLNRIWMNNFCEEFTEVYTSIHRYETNRIRNIAKFFAHLLHTDALPWTVLSCVHMTEDDTTSSSRIFMKILMQGLAESFGVKSLVDRFVDKHMSDSFAGMFPRDSAKDTRFAINYYTSIGLGPLTDELRQHLVDMSNALAIKQQQDDSSSSSSELSDSSSDSDSEYEPRNRSRSPPRHRFSRSPPRRNDSRSPPRRRR